MGLSVLVGLHDEKVITPKAAPLDVALMPGPSAARKTVVLSHYELPPSSTSAKSRIDEDRPVGQQATQPDTQGTQKPLRAYP